MADTDTTTTQQPQQDPNQLLQQLAQQLGSMGQVPQADQTPVSRSFISLLGEGVGGGDPTGQMSPAQREAAGVRSLLSFGSGMLAASGYHPVRTTMGEALAAGIQGATQAETGSAELASQTLGQRQALAMKQQEMRLAALKEAIPLLRLQMGANIPNPLAGGGGGTTGVPGTTPGTSLAAVARDTSVPTAGQQANNPGNVMADSGAPFGATGYIPVSGGRKVAVYPDLTTGIAANAANLAGYAGKGVSTVADAVKTWVGDPKADLTSYTNDVAKALGVSPTDKIDLTNPAVQKAFILAQQPHESGKLWLTPDAVDKGVALAQTWRTRPPQPAGGPAQPPRVQVASNAPIVPQPAPAPATTTPAPAVAQPRPQTALLPPELQPPVPITTTPPATTQATTAPPAATPGAKLTFEQWQAQHPMPQIDPATYTVTPPDLTAAIAAKNAAAQTLDLIHKGLSTADPNKATQAYTEASQNVTKLQQDAQSKSLEMQQTARQQAIDTQRQLYDAEQQRLQQADEADKQRQAAVALEQLRGKQAVELEQAKGRTADESKVMQGLDETRETARGAIDQLDLARSLSASAGDPTFWQQIQQSHPDLVRWVANLGGLSTDQVQQLGQAGALDAALNKLISMARTGSGFQRMTNLDVQILSSQAPQGTDPQAWRDAKLAYLQNYMGRQMRYVDAVRSMRADGTPLYEAQNRADKAVGDIVPQMPAFQDTPQKSAADQRKEWAQTNIPPNTFFRAPDGKSLIIWPPRSATTQQTQTRPGPQVPTTD